MFFYVITAIYALIMCILAFNLSRGTYLRHLESKYTIEVFAELFAFPAILGAVFMIFGIGLYGLFAFLVLWGLMMLAAEIGRRSAVRSLRYHMHLRKRAKDQLEAQRPWKDWQPNDPSKSAH